jgi:hypothetical protein
MDYAILILQGTFDEDELTARDDKALALDELLSTAESMPDILLGRLIIGVIGGVDMPDEAPKLDLPAQMVELLRKAGPVWSGVLGFALVGLGVRFKQPNLIGPGIGTLALGVLLWRLQPKSKLIKKEAFRAISNVYVGRQEECENLLKAIKRFSLIWVIGESGSGKSLLLTKGVIPQLRGTKGYVPLYVEYWGEDWEKGPIASVVAALKQEVEGWGANLNSTGTPGAEEMASYLADIAKLKGCRPVLILDQFDDYIVQNLDKFCPPGSGLVTAASEMQEQNAFWRQIAQLLTNGTIICLLVVRQEQGWGQSTLSFVKVHEFLVRRLRTEYFDQILRELGENAVSHPEHGWDTLRDEISQDLKSGGSSGILPIQMRLITQQLPSLKHLTVRDYKKAGRSLGLATRYCAEVVACVSEVTRIDRSLVIDTLYCLVNPDDYSKTRDISTMELLECIGHAADARKVSLLLDRLKEEEVVRERADETGQKRWRLEHDYLAMAAYKLHRQSKLERQHRKLLGQRFGISPLLALVVFLANTMVFVTGFATLGVGWLTSIPVAIVVGLLTYFMQVKWYRDDRDSAIIKAMIVGFLTSIPTALPGYLVIPMGIIGLIHDLRREIGSG